MKDHTLLSYAVGGTDPALPFNSASRALRAKSPRRRHLPTSRRLKLNSS